MLDAQTMYDHVGRQFGWERAAPIIEFTPEQVKAGPAKLVKDAFARLIVRAPESRAALLRYPPPKVPINPLADDSEAYGLSAALNDAFLTDGLVRKHIGERPISFLDFGCGTGRVLSFLAQFNPQNRYSGCDVVQSGLDYIAANGIPGDFRQMQNLPPAPFESRSFDAILAWSIFTHYSQDYADAWMADLHRMLRPGAFLFLTYSTETTLATMRADKRPLSSEPDMIAKMETDFAASGFGFAPSYIDRMAITEADYQHFGMTIMSRDYIAQRWRDRFELIETTPAVVGWQDMAVLKAI